MIFTPPLINEKAADGFNVTERLGRCMLMNIQKMSHSHMNLQITDIME